MRSLLKMKDKKLGRVVFLFKHLLLAILFFQYPFFLEAQSIDSVSSWRYTLSNEVDFVTTDALQQLYVASDDGYIVKLDRKGQLLFEYNNKRLGKVGGIDTTNPFNILVYYPEFATVIFLDRTLSEIKSINLFDLQIFEPKVVALSNDNNIWIYDPINFQFKKISREGKVLFQSKNLNQVTSTTIQPSFLVEQNNQLILGDTTQGIFIFDAFGQLKQRIKTISCSQFQLFNNQVFYFKKGKLLCYSFLTEEEKVIQLFPNATQVLLLDEGWVAIEGREIVYYLR